MAVDIVPELLRTIQGDIAGLRNEIRDGFARVEVRLGLVEHGLADLLGVSASDRDEIRSLKTRVERIEHRLELSE
jgi:predicted component of type VI protein secretion system